MKNDYKGDNILGLFDSSDLEHVESILINNKALLDYEGEDKAILARIEALPSIADIINKIGKEKINLMSEEDRNIYFSDTIFSEKYI